MNYNLMYKFTGFFNNLFLKKNKTYWRHLRSLVLHEYLIELQRNFKYKSDLYWWDCMYSPEILCYYKEADCSSYANMNFEYCKFHKITCKLYALTRKGSGHAIVGSDKGIFSNIDLSNETLEEYMKINNWTHCEVLKEYNP